MPCELLILPAFQRQRKEVAKKYPRSEQAVEEVIRSLANDPRQGDAYPGFPFEVRKVRLALKAYRLSARDGLRLLFLHLETKARVVPLAIYKKGAIKSEADVIRLVKEKLREVLAEIEEGKTGGEST